jgi:apolipoprotein N-acyltransferase
MELSVPVRPAPPPQAVAPPTHDATGRSVAGAARRPALAVLSGLLVYLAFPPVGFWPLAPVGVALLVLACRGVRVRTGFGLGLLHGMALFLPLVEWVSSLAGLPALVALSLLQALFLAGLGSALAAVARVPGWPLWTAALWVGEEALRSRLPFGGFTWGRLAFSQGESFLLPLAALGGAPLLTFALGGLGAALAWAVVVLRRRKRPPRRAWVAALAGVLAVPAAAALVPSATGPAPSTRVALVQGNVPRLGLSFNDQRAAVLQNHVDGTRALAADVRAGRVPRPDLVIWPENASDIDPLTDPAAFSLIDGAVADIGVPTLVGALLEGPRGQVRNAGVVWDPQTGPGEIYVKRKLVPFGEYVPLRGLVSAVTDLVALVPRDFARGDRPGVLDVGPARVGDLMCYEIAFDGSVRDVVRGGGRVLTVQTNNATFGRSAQTEQQLAMGRLRAVEHGRAVLVAATSGISAVIGPDGQVTQRAEVFTPAVLSAEVPLRDDRTLATRLGAAPELVLSLAGAAGLALAGLRRRART